MKITVLLNLHFLPKKSLGQNATFSEINWFEIGFKSRKKNLKTRPDLLHDIIRNFFTFVHRAKSWKNRKIFD